MSQRPPASASTSSESSQQRPQTVQYASAAPSVATLLNIPTVQSTRRPAASGLLGLAARPVSGARPVVASTAAATGAAPPKTVAITLKKPSDGATSETKDVVLTSHSTSTASTSHSTATASAGHVKPDRPSKKQHKPPRVEKAVSQAPLRTAGGETWEDASLLDWDPAHFRLFVGNLGTEVTDSLFHTTFSNRYPSVSRSKIVRDRHSGRSKGYGFVAFADGKEFLRAVREMQGQWIGHRQCQVKKSDWKARNAPV